LIGAVVGIGGLSIIFSNEISSTQWSLNSDVAKGFMWMLLATFFASIGMLAIWPISSSENASSSE
jgi:hypothetical protein